MEKKKAKFNIPLIFLGFVFLVLKLTGVVNWSWGWILSPWIVSAVLMLFGLSALTLTYKMMNHPKVKMQLMDDEMKKDFLKWREEQKKKEESN